MRRIQKLLVATDFSEVSDVALAEAVSLAEQLGATVVLFHAIELPLFGPPELVLASTSTSTRELEVAARASLARLVERHRGGGVSIETMIRVGPASLEIEMAAGECNADLVIVGAHRRRAFARLLLGSVAARIVRASVRPVLVVHGPPDVVLEQKSA
jgi:nucleotide-binding universal stress UspA family protein